LWLNQFHHDWLDPIMFQMSKTQFWVPLHLLLIYLIFKRYEAKAWLLLACTALVILFSDQLTSTFMKPLFERLRPSHEPTLQGLVHLVNDYKGGRYGFASSHAANTFGVAMLMFLSLRAYYRYAGLIFLWATLVSYTRIYLGVHYPGDIITGGVIGACAGWAGYLLFQALHRKLDVRLKETVKGSG